MSLQDAQDESIRQFSNLLIPNNLYKNIINSALVLLVFETLKDLIINNLYDFYTSSIIITKNKDINSHSETLENNKRKKEKKYFTAALEWFQTQNILSTYDIEVINAAKELRKNIAHDLFSKLAHGLSEKDIALISQVQHIYEKLIIWWGNTIETDKGVIANLQKDIDNNINLNNISFFQNNIINSILFILIFESLKNLIIEELRGFYCNSYNLNKNKISIIESKQYKQKVRSLNSANIFYASLQWFQNHDAISESDVQVIKQIEKCRNNDIVHNYFTVLTNGLSQEYLSLLSQMIQIYDKLDSWWVYNIEADWDEIPNPESVKEEDCHSMDVVMLHVILDILNGNANQYSDWPEQIKAAVLKKRSQAREKENG